MEYSKQARLIIDNLKDFDKAEFERKFNEEYKYGGGDIINYLDWKNKIR